MIFDSTHTRVGILVSGGLDSSILLGQRVRQSARVQPIYVQSDVLWQAAELAALRRFLCAIACPNLESLKILNLPLSDLYGEHWSTGGQSPPGADSPDEAVYLPGRNALLAIKAAVWCQLHGIDRLALAVLGTSPFADAKPAFFDPFAAALTTATGKRLAIECPFGGLRKREVMQLGCGLPLEHTFSCIAPVDGQHCGQCNKCAERREAFRLAGMTDPTHYAAPSGV